MHAALAFSDPARRDERGGACFLALSPLQAGAQAFETEASAAFVIDHGTGQVLCRAQCRRAVCRRRRCRS